MGQQHPSRAVLITSDDALIAATTRTCRRFAEVRVWDIAGTSR
jgi:hypothetical protein